MKILKYIYLSILSCIIICYSQSINAQYYGGNSDGAQKNSIIQITLNGNQINTLVLYRGGSGDGHDKSSTTTTIAGNELAILYKGGNNDGHSKLSFLTTLGGDDLSILYIGGIGDGHNKSDFLGALDGITISGLYSGGIGDGHDKSSFSGVLTGEEISQLYSGGIGDGHDKLSVSSLLNGEMLNQLYSGGFGDGFDKDAFTGVIDGTLLSGLYSGGSGDGFSKNEIQYIFDFPECTFVVNTDDDGFGSLRYAINCAIDGDTIQFSPLLLDDSILLTTGPLMVFQNLLHIDVDTSKNLTVDGSLTSNTLFTGLNGPAELTIKGLNLMSGVDPFGSTIVNGGQLTLEDLDIIDTYNSSATLIATFNGGTLIIKGTVRLLDN